MTRNGPNMYHINTNNQLELELPVAISNNDVIQVLVYEVVVSFAKNVPRINLVTESEMRQQTSTPPTFKSLEIADKDLMELNTELYTRKESEALKGNSVLVKYGQRKEQMLWEWKIRCGGCKQENIMRPDAGLKGRIAYFDRHHYNACRLKTGDKRKVRPAKDFFNQSKRKRKASDEQDNSVAQSVVVIDDDEVNQDVEAIDDSYLEE
ncbi:uncharacterized protein [Clytia hemisphaerica]|uniref:uncharacterized protein n=1 Tax=Clytia hemisphaerica TaxID=252671 RepID=UPI0034D44F3D